ncbi:hypothetical protein FKM82_005656 [Ascaphus truei]
MILLLMVQILQINIVAVIPKWSGMDKRTQSGVGFDLSQWAVHTCSRARTHSETLIKSAPASNCLKLQFSLFF